MKTDILAFAAHPDDAELSCSGTLMKLTASGKVVGVIDLTAGELGTRGTPQTRAEEAAAAAKIMGIAVRENLGFRDGFFTNDEIHQMAIIRIIRKYRPDILFANAISDRHPDHGKAAALVRDAAFLSGLRRIETTDNGAVQEAWRPRRIWHYIQDRYLTPSVIVDITPFWEKKLEAIRAFSSQFYNPESTEPESYISSAHFLYAIEGRSKEMGHRIGADHGEGFITEAALEAKDISEW